ncbi:MAG TPA: hypothetical protein VK629_21300 [Steroidobacteraceae bacterium]|nr:hypothetical protein [Steroidobacteraceae bacterium]
MKSHLIVLFTLVLLGPGIAKAQVVDGSVTLNGIAVRTQKMTVDCDWWVPADGGTVYLTDSIRQRLSEELRSRDLHLWESHSKKYSIHLIDTRQMTADQRSKLRPEAYGAFDWSEKKWSSLASVTENELVVASWLNGGPEVLKIVMSNDRTLNEYTYTMNLGFAFAIDRSTLESITKKKYACTSSSSSGECYIGNDESRGLQWSDFPAPPSRGKCKVLAYEKPPVRIGF